MWGNVIVSDGKSKPKTGFSGWWNKQSMAKQAILFMSGLIGVFLLIGISSVFILYSSTVSQSHSQGAISHSSVNSNDMLNNSTTTPSTTSQGSYQDYNDGFDEGYFNGVNDAYSGSSYEGVPSKSSQFTDMWREGFREGYKQGYADIKNGRPLQKPRTQGTAILDPRTGESIYA